MHDVGLRLARNRTTAILGPGGAGKTTLLKLLGPAESSVPGLWHKGGLTVYSGPASLLPQKNAYSGASLIECFAEAEGGRGDPLSTLRSVWSAAPEAAHTLIPVLDLPMGSLPASLARLAAFTATVARRGSFFVLDEPDVGIDGQLLDWVIAKLEALRGAATVVIATHHLGLARTVSDDSILLVGGRIVESGPTDALFDRPRRERTRAFVRMGH